SLDGVAESVPFPAGWLRLESPDGTWQTEGQVYGVDADRVSPALRDTESVRALTPGTVGLSEDYLEASGLQGGSPGMVSGPDGSHDATVVELGLGEIVLPADDLAALDGSAEEGGLLIRLAEDVDVGAVVSEIRRVVD